MLYILPDEFAAHGYLSLWTLDFIHGISGIVCIRSVTSKGLESGLGPGFLEV